MSIHTANSLTLSEILDRIKQVSNPSKDPSIVELVSTYLKEHKQDYTPFDARRWIDIMSSNQKNILAPKNEFDLVKKYETINHPSLLFYLKQQQIPLSIAQQYLSELKVCQTAQKKQFFMLGFPHEDDGFFIANHLMKDWIGEPSVSFIRGQDSTSDTIHILHTFWDYLSLLAHLKTEYLQTDILILNAYICVPQVKAYLYQYGYQKAYSWFGNDKEGTQALRTLSSILMQEDNLIHIAMNAFYQPFIHLAEWYQQQVRI